MEVATGKETKRDQKPIWRSSNVAQKQQIWLVHMRIWVQSLASLSGLNIWCCCELLFWVWCRPSIASLIWAPAWGFPYAACVALKSKKKKKKERNYGWKLPKSKKEKRYWGIASTGGPKQNKPKETHIKTYHH